MQYLPVLLSIRGLWLFDIGGQHGPGTPRLGWAHGLGGHGHNSEAALNTHEKWPGHFARAFCTYKSNCNVFPSHKGA